MTRLGRFATLVSLLMFGVLSATACDRTKHAREPTGTEAASNAAKASDKRTASPTTGSSDTSKTRSDVPEMPVESTVLVPRGESPDSGWPTVVLMHGYRAGPDDLVPIARIARESGFVAISLPAPLERGAGHYHWKQGHPPHTHRYLQHHLAAIASSRKAELQTSRIWLVGFSQGALHGLHLVAKHPDRYRGLFAISPAGWTDVPDEIEHPEETRRFVITGGKREPDKYRQTFLDTRTLLKSYDFPLEIVDHDQGHEFPPDWQTLARETFQTWRRADAE
jgi:predicted esterase